MTSYAIQYHGNGILIIVLSISLGLFLVSLTNNFVHFMNSVSAQLLTQYGQQSSNSNTQKCPGNGFSLYYPSNWTQYSCTLFNPGNREIFPNPSPAADTYVRITPAYNLSTPTSIDNLTRDITYFADGNIYHLMNPPYYPHNLKVPNAVELDYEWNTSTEMLGPPQVALPYVNQSTTPTSTYPTISSQAINTPGQISPLNRTGVTPSPKLVGPADHTPVNPSNGQTQPLNHTGVTPSPKLVGPANKTNVNNPKETGAPAPTYNEMTAAIYFIKGNKVYVFEYTAPAGQPFKDSLSKATEMVNSFEIR